MSLIESNKDFAPISIDPIKIADDYLDKKNWRTRENSTSSWAVGSLNAHMSATISAHYWLYKIYTNEIREAHKNCQFHLHDLQCLTSYCSGWNIRDLLEQGLGGVKDKISSGPAKHLNTAMQHVINFFGVISNEQAGAQAFNSFDTYLAPFIRVDKMDDTEIEQAIQNFLFGVNIPSRWAFQAPFTNVTLDLLVPNDLKDKKPTIAGKKQNFTYGDIQPEMNRFNKIFMKVFERGDYTGGMFQYPIVTFNCVKDFFEKLDPELEEQIYKVTAKYGIPYFSNYISSDMDPSDLRSLCCRLRLDLRQITKKNGSIFGSSESTGSIGVVTLNMPQLGYLSNSQEELFNKLEALMITAKESLELKREQLKIWFEQGLYPYTKRYLTAGYDNHFSTIGLVGMNEMCRNFFRNTKKKDLNIASKEGKELAEKVLDFMVQKSLDFQEETGNLYNIEQTPAESTSYRLAKHDKQRFSNILTAGTEQTPYYTNSCHLPVGYTDDPWVAIKHQESLQTKFTGGCVLHCFLNESPNDWHKVKDFVKKVMYNSRLPYITITPTFSHCQIHGYISGNTDVCPYCKEEVVSSYQKKLNELKAQREKLIEETNA